MSDRWETAGERRAGMRVMLAQSFLILVGVVLIGEGLDLHVPKAYIYFAMAFSFLVEMMNIRMRKKRARPVVLHGPKG